MEKSKWAAVLSFGQVTLMGIFAIAVCVVTHRLCVFLNATSDAIAVISKSVDARSAPPAAMTDAQVACLRAASDRIDVITSNLANAQTPGFKRKRVDGMSGPLAQWGASQIDMTQGALESTGSPMDAAISGDGFFHVKLDPNTADGTGYIRNGSLTRNDCGDLIANIGPGYELIPPINIPAGATNIQISPNGTVQYNAVGGSKVVTAGSIELSQFVNPQGLNEQAHGIYTETALSGPPTVNNPGNNGAGTLQEGYLESSNVDPIAEWAIFLKAVESLRMDDQAARIADQALASVINLDAFRHTAVKSSAKQKS